MAEIPSHRNSNQQSTGKKRGSRQSSRAAKYLRTTEIEAAAQGQTAAEVLKIVVAVQAGKSVRKCGNLWCRQAGHTKATCQTMKPPVGAAAAGGVAAAIASAPIAAGDFDSDDDGEASSDEEGGDDGAGFYDEEDDGAGFEDEEDDGAGFYDEEDDSAGFEDEGIGGAPISSYASSGILPAPPVATTCSGCTFSRRQHGAAGHPAFCSRRGS